MKGEQIIKMNEKLKNVVLCSLTLVVIIIILYYIVIEFLPSSDHNNNLRIYYKNETNEKLGYAAVTDGNYIY